MAAGASLRQKPPGDGAIDARMFARDMRHHLFARHLLDIVRPSSQHHRCSRPAPAMSRKCWRASLGCRAHRSPPPREAISRARVSASVGPSRRKSAITASIAASSWSSETPSAGVALTETVPPPSPEESAHAPAATAMPLVLHQFAIEPAGLRAAQNFHGHIERMRLAAVIGARRNGSDTCA